MKKLNGLKRVLTLALALVFVLSVAFVPKTAYAYDGAADVRAEIGRASCRERV